MNDEPRINDLLEAFRPEVDDLATEAWQPLRAPLASDGDVQRRAESIQRHDRVIRSAMHDVPVPAGLAERLLANLPEGDAADVLASAPAIASEAVNLPSHPAASTGFGRRTWATIAVGTALAAVGLVIGLWREGPPGRGPASEEDLARMVGTWENDAELSSGGAWRAVPTPQGLSSHPIDPSDLRVPAARIIGPVWRDEMKLVVYDLTTPGGKTARLYVAYTGRTFDVPTTPQSLLRLTGGRSGIAWQRGHYLYVAVVDSQTARPTEFVKVRDFT